MLKDIRYIRLAIHLGLAATQSTTDPHGCTLNVGVRWAPNALFHHLDIATSDNPLHFRMQLIAQSCPCVAGIIRTALRFRPTTLFEFCERYLYGLATRDMSRMLP
jgi:hypothetical protein